MLKTTITLKVDQNGGEYYGITKITLPEYKNIERKGKTLVMGEIELEFDEWFEILNITTQ